MAFGMPHGMAFGMPHGMVFGMPHGMAFGIPHGMANGMARDMPKRMILRRAARVFHPGQVSPREAGPRLLAGMGATEELHRDEPSIVILSNADGARFPGEAFNFYRICRNGF